MVFPLILKRQERFSFGFENIWDETSSKLEVWFLWIRAPFNASLKNLEIKMPRNSSTANICPVSLWKSYNLLSGYTCIHLFSPRAGGGFPSAPPNLQTIAPRAAVLPEPRTKAVFLLICSPADSSCLQRWSGWELEVHLLHFSTGSNQGAWPNPDLL